MNGELISRSKCKRQAATQQTSLCILNADLYHPTDSSEQTKNQLIQTNTQELSQQIGRQTPWNIAEETDQTIVFLPGLDSSAAFLNLPDLTELLPSEPVITDTGQESTQLQVEHLDDSTFLLYEELLTPITITHQFVHPGEDLNTPTVGKSLFIFGQGH